MDTSIKLARRKRLAERHLAPPLASLLSAVESGNEWAVTAFAESLAEQFADYAHKINANGYGRPIVRPGMETGTGEGGSDD